MTNAIEEAKAALRRAEVEMGNVQFNLKQGMPTPSREWLIETVSRWSEALAASRALAALSGEGDQHPDDAAVDRFAAAMKVKLAKKRRDGRGGWSDPEQCSAETLSRLLREHVDKGDPLDVGNLAMMLQQRGEPIQSAPALSGPAPSGLTQPACQYCARPAADCNCEVAGVVGAHGDDPEAKLRTIARELRETAAKDKETIIYPSAAETFAQAFVLAADIFAEWKLRHPAPSPSPAPPAQTDTLANQEKTDGQ